MKFTRPFSNRTGMRPAGKVWILTACTALLAFLVFAGLGSQTLALEPETSTVRFETILPADTLAFVRCSGVDELLADGETLQLMQLWNDPEVQAFLADAREQLPRVLNLQDGGERSRHLQHIKRLLQGEIAMAVSPRITIFEEGAAPAMALAMDMGRDKESFLNIMKGVGRLIMEQHPLEQGSFDYRGFNIGYMGNLKKRWTICHAVIDNLFVLTINRYYLQDIIDHHLDGKPSLARNPAFRTCLKKVGGKGTDLMLYVSLQPLIDVVKPVAPYEAIEWLNLLGLNNINALCLGSTMENGRSRDSLFIHSPGEKQGLLKALVPHPVSKESLKMIPPDAILCSSFVFDPERILKEIDGFVHTALPEYYDMFRMGMDEVKRETSFDLQKDFFGPLGSEISWFVTIPKSGMIKLPNLFFSVSLDDVEGFKAFHNRLMSMLEGQAPVMKSMYKDYTLVYIPLPEAPYTPTFSLVGNRLLVASSPMVMKQYLMWRDSGEPGLYGNKRFKAALAEVPKDASAVSYVDLHKAIELGYNTVLPIIPNITAQTGLPLDPGLIPMTDTLSRHFTSVCSYMVSDKDGWLVTKRTPLGLSSFMAVTLHMADYFVTRNLLPHGGGQGSGHKKVVGEQPRPSVDEGIKLMEQGNFEAAEAVFGKVIDSGSKDGLVRALLNRGYCRLKLGRNQDAVEDYLYAAEKDESCRHLAYYNIACGTSLMNEKDKALKFLEKALEEGFNDWDLLHSDPDLANIRQDPRYDAIVNKKM